MDWRPATPAADISTQLGEEFAGKDGRAPDMQFEGINNRISLGPYLIHAISILPYPQTLQERAKLSNYRITFIVQEQQ